MTTAAATERAVRQILDELAPEADLATLDPDAQLQDALDLDSADFLTFVTSIHETTAVDVPERDYPKIATLSSCVSYLGQRSADPVGR